MNKGDPDSNTWVFYSRTITTRTRLALNIMRIRSPVSRISTFVHRLDASLCNIISTVHVAAPGPWGPLTPPGPWSPSTGFFGFGTLSYAFGLGLRLLSFPSPRLRLGRLPSWLWPWPWQSWECVPRPPPSQSSPSPPAGARRGELDEAGLPESESESDSSLESDDDSSLDSPTAFGGW